MFQSGGQAEDIALVCALGLGINNDNMLAPENIPGGANTVTTNTNTKGDSEHLEEGWGWLFLCPFVEHLVEMTLGIFCSWR